MHALRSQLMYVLWALPLQSAMDTALLPLSMLFTMATKTTHSLTAPPSPRSSLWLPPSSTTTTTATTNQQQSEQQDNSSSSSSSSTQSSSSSSSLLLLEEEDDEEAGSLENSSSTPSSSSTNRVLLQWVGQITHQVAQDVGSLLIPSPQTRRRHWELKRDFVLDRLKLEAPAAEDCDCASRENDGEDDEEEDSEDEENQQTDDDDDDEKCSPSTSDFLLRVADLQLVSSSRQVPPSSPHTGSSDANADLSNNHNKSAVEGDHEKDGAKANNRSDSTHSTTNTKPRTRTRIVTFVDLAAPPQSDEAAWIPRALDQLVHQGFTLLSQHPTVQLHNPLYHTLNPTTRIDWTCQGSTRSVLQRLQTQSVWERLQTMQSETLVWSGSFVGDAAGTQNAKYPLYLARGVIPIAPRDLLDLLWDNDRTKEYNAFCLGRETLMELNHLAFEDCSHAVAAEGQEKDSNHNKKNHNNHHQYHRTKVISSQTRVPLTSFTVQVQCLMHCRPLQEPHDHGFVIVSRSLHSGPSGTTFVSQSQDNAENGDNSGDKKTRKRHRHHKNKPSQNNKKKNNIGKGPSQASSSSTKKNEILWGINVIRSVPNHPHLTDLTSLSQVGYSLGVIPQFLASQIAIRGVQEFFDTMRRLDYSSKKKKEQMNNQSQVNNNNNGDGVDKA
ncbi:hypothetical protein ACA910_006270 [Epithemia clementina (nom. ined.)]